MPELKSFFGKNLKVVMLDNGVPNLNFKGFILDNTHANWIAVRKIYGASDPRVPMEGHECMCIFHWSTKLDKTTHTHLKPSLQHHHKQIYKEHKDAKSMEDTIINTMWIVLGGCP